MGAYDRFKDAEPMGVRKYIEPGAHRLLVRRTVQGPSTHPDRKGKEKTVVELKIVRSDTMKVGETCSLVETEGSAGYFGNVLEFTAGILGYGVDEMKKDEQFNEVFGGCWGPDQLLIDMLVDCVAQKVGTTKGGEYTAKTWTPVHASEYEKDGLVAPNGAFGLEPPAEAPASA